MRCRCSESLIHVFSCWAAKTVDFGSTRTLFDEQQSSITLFAPYSTSAAHVLDAPLSYRFELRRSEELLVLVDGLWLLLVRYNENQPMYCHLQQIRQDPVHFLFSEMFDHPKCGDRIKLSEHAQIFGEQISLNKLYLGQVALLC